VVPDAPPETPPEAVPELLPVLAPEVLFEPALLPVPVPALFCAQALQVKAVTVKAAKPKGWKIFLFIFEFSLEFFVQLMRLHRAFPKAETLRLNAVILRCFIWAL
jgi:hypothetical protein